jgi:hypothetical protein
MHGHMNVKFVWTLYLVRVPPLLPLQSQYKTLKHNVSKYAILHWVRNARRVGNIAETDC